VKRVVLKGLALGVLACFEKGTKGPKGGMEAVHVSCSSEDGNHGTLAVRCVCHNFCVEGYSRMCLSKTNVGRMPC
jgi:hypothetical protein